MAALLGTVVQPIARLRWPERKGAANDHARLSLTGGQRIPVSHWMSTFASEPPMTRATTSSHDMPASAVTT